MFVAAMTISNEIIYWGEAASTGKRRGCVTIGGGRLVHDHMPLGEKGERSRVNGRYAISERTQEESRVFLAHEKETMRLQ